MLAWGVVPGVQGASGPSGIYNFLKNSDGHPAAKGSTITITFTPVRIFLERYA
jgi:hypothetical protein